MRDSIRLFCPAKLNLFLDVLGKRPDGYHEIATAMVPLDFGDTLAARRSRETRLRVVPADAAPAAGNTVLRAVEALRRLTRFRGGVDFVLRKRVPVGSGLGGGSSDAAAALRAADALYGLRAPPEVLRLAASEVGSDVPFFLLGGPALAAGRGELLAPLPRRPPLHFLVLLPPRGLSTAAVYAEVNESLTRRTPAVSNFLNLWTSSDFVEIRRVLFNALETPALKLFPELGGWMRRFGRYVPGVRMSGSGSALYGLCRSRAEAARLRGRVGRSLPLRCWVASSAAS